MQHGNRSSRRNCSADAQVGALMPSSCGLFQGVDTGSGALSIFFTATAMNEQQQQAVEDSYTTSSCTSPSSAVVDCTLSLGTPSTRHQTSSTAPKPSPLLPAVIQRQKRHNNYPLRFFELLPFQHKQATPPTPSITADAAAVRGVAAGSDTLLLRRCANCDTTSTPLWRNGPRGPKSLCNACGIRFKKEERRAASSAACLSSSSSSSASSQHQQQQHYSWVAAAAPNKCPFAAPMYSLGETNVEAMEAAALPYPAWQPRFHLGVHPQAAEFATSGRFLE